jgi:hypothetical protein
LKENCRYKYQSEQLAKQLALQRVKFFEREKNELMKANPIELVSLRTRTIF